MPRTKKKSTKIEKKEELKEQPIDSIEKEQEEIIEPVTFQYVGNLKETTTIIGKVTRNSPFTVSDINQINHFRNLNTFEELPEGYKVKEVISIIDPGDMDGLLESDQIDEEYLEKIIDDESEKDVVVKE